MNGTERFALIGGGIIAALGIWHLVTAKPASVSGADGNATPVSGGSVNPGITYQVMPNSTPAQPIDLGATVAPVVLPPLAAPVFNNTTNLVTPGIPPQSGSCCGTSQPSFIMIAPPLQVPQQADPVVSPRTDNVYPIAALTLLDAERMRDMQRQNWMLGGTFAPWRG